MMDWYGGMGWGGWVVGSVTMLAFFALIVVGVIALVGGRPIARLGVDRRTVDELLDQRLARGEIDVEEYTHRRELLRRGADRKDVR